MKFQCTNYWIKLRRYIKGVVVNYKYKGKRINLHINNQIFAKNERIQMQINHIRLYYYFLIPSVAKILRLKNKVKNWFWS